MNLRLFYSTVAFQHFAYGVIIPTLLVWQNNLGLSFTEIGIIQTAGILAVLVSEVPSSYFADKVGQKTTLLFAFFATICNFYLLIQAQEFWSFLFAQICFSFGIAFFSGTQESLLHDLVEKPKSMTRFLARMSIVDESATIVGMLASSLLIAFYNIETSFSVAFVSLVLGLIAMFVLKVPEKVHSESIKLNTFRLEYFHVFILVLFFSVMAFRGEILFQSSFALNSTILAALGGIYTFGKLFSILGSFVSDVLEQKFGFKLSMLVALILQTVSFSLLIFFNQVIGVLALAIYFFSENVFRNIRDSWILNCAPQKLRSTFISGVSFSGAIFALALNPIVGYSIDQSFYYAVIAVVLIKLLAGLMFYILAPKKIVD